MPSQKSLESPSPSISPAILELAAESRRGSLTSQLSRETAANDSVSNTLDYIHTSASRSDALTTFDEFSSPPRPQSSGEGKVFGGDIVQGGLSGLYSRIKASVGVTKETLGPSPAVTATDPTDDASVRSLTFNATLPGTESPVVVSASSSRLQSPLVATFPESVLSAQLQHSNPSNASLLSGSSIPAPHASLTEPAANSPEELRQRPNTTSPLVRPTINPRHIETKQASRLSNVSDVAKNSREPIGDALGIPDIRVSRQGDSHSFSSHESSVMDQERSPRPLARLAADNQRSAFDSSSKSPARRDILKNDWTDAGKKSALVFEEPVQNLISRPPLVQVSQSHLPGFQVSRGNSTDGDYSSVASGPVTARKHHNEPVEAVSGRSELPSMNEIQDAAARMRSKVLAKELWMRDETAKECFYCGESFSTFRRKHHCRKYYRSALIAD
jgi:1-phosphatidylinositol-3-phosphate 5-kinase